MQTENYLQSGEIVLPGLDEKIQLPERTFYRYEGALEDAFTWQIALIRLKIKGHINDNRSKISEILDRNTKLQVIKEADFCLYLDPNMDEYSGYCHRFMHNYNNYFMIGKKANLSPNLDVFTDGHESGELLNFLGKVETMQELLAKAGINLDASRFRNEDFADIGGMLALQKSAQKTGQTINPPEFRRRGKVRPEITKAFNL